MKELRFSFAYSLPNPTTIFGRETMDPGSNIGSNVSIRGGLYHIDGFRNSFTS